MLAIHKQQIPLSATFTLQMAAGAEILTIREQYGRPCMWYKCDPSVELQDQVFALIGTGGVAPLESEGRYVGTWYSTYLKSAEPRAVCFRPR